MPTKLLTLVFCLAALPPQQLCACHVVARLTPHGTHTPHPADGSHAGADPCLAHTGLSAAAWHAQAGHDAPASPACPCACHTDPDGPPDCPHATREAVDSPKPVSPDDLPDLPPPFLCTPVNAVPALARPVPSPPPGAGHVPRHLMFCVLRN